MSKFTKLINNQRFGRWLTVITLSVITATINILHVIIGLARTPNGYTYLATGHYYLDYFIYLAQIAQGAAGAWRPFNYYTSDNLTVDWRFFPYTLIGKIGGLLQLSPMLSYWLAVFFLTIIVVIGFYYLINLMLKGQPFYLKIVAWLMAMWSGPFYQISINNGQFSLNPFDFWYGPANFIRRFGVVPYHTLGVILLVIIIIFINNIWEKIAVRSVKTIIINSLVTAGLLVVLMTFSPIVILCFLPALLITSTIYFIMKKSQRLKLFLLNTILLILIIPAGLYLRKTSGYGGFSFETQWIEHVPWWYLLLNLGPLIVLFPFGVIDYLRTNGFVRLILLILTLVSYGLFFSPLAAYLGTHNLRFFSSISYVFFAVLAADGLQRMTNFSKKKQPIIIMLIFLLFLLYSSWFNIEIIKQRLLGFDPRTPDTRITYVPTSIINNLKLLQRYPKDNIILTAPVDDVGMLVPIFSNKRVYIGHLNATLNYNYKWQMANRFFAGLMTEAEAKIFVKTNNIGLVILTILDHYNSNNLVQYRFLTPILTNSQITVWQVK